jgi:hypothetical protein
MLWRVRTVTKHTLTGDIETARQERASRKSLEKKAFPTVDNVKRPCESVRMCYFSRRFTIAVSPRSLKLQIEE